MVGAGCGGVVHDLDADAATQEGGQYLRVRKPLPGAGAEQHEFGLKVEQDFDGGSVELLDRPRRPVRMQAFWRQDEAGDELLRLDRDGVLAHPAHAQDAFAAVLDQAHRRSARQDDLRSLVAATIGDRHVADALHQGGIDPPQQIGEGVVARLPVLGGDLQLDQLVMGERQIHLGCQCIGHALGTDLDDRLQTVRKATQMALLGGAEGLGHDRWRRAVEGAQGYHAIPDPLDYHRTVPMARSRTSRAWLKEHFADAYVKRAQAEGLRSRAAYKLEELIERDRLFRPGMTVVDLGAAPGGWSQVTRRALGDSGRVVALDILDMPPIAGVEFVHGDFSEAEALSRLEALLGAAAVDLVLSDMAPNMTGVAAVDQARSMNLVELARDFAQAHLRPGGGFLFKMFQGVGSDAFLLDLRKRYEKVQVRKPKASRLRSSEVYVLASGKRAMPK